MAIQPYLAMTAAEAAKNSQNYPRIAWLDCHFSPTGTGLENLPGQLPEGALLTLSDRIPIGSQEPEAVCEILSGIVEEFGCKGLLLDFQRPFTDKLLSLSGALVQALPCPVAVSDTYAKGLDCPVFLSPLPLHKRLEAHISPWNTREIWLDVSAEAERITVTPAGARFDAFPRSSAPGTGHSDDTLHCHYAVSVTEAAAEFVLWRTGDDVSQLLEEAEQLGISYAVSLYQEWEDL